MSKTRPSCLKNHVTMMLTLSRIINRHFIKSREVGEYIPFKVILKVKEVIEIIFKFINFKSIV